jgi:hypothetical protein
LKALVLQNRLCELRVVARIAGEAAAAIRDYYGTKAETFDAEGVAACIEEISACLSSLRRLASEVTAAKEELAHADKGPG